MTMTQLFKLTNMGSLPLRIHATHIALAGCTAHGLSVVPCFANHVLNASETVDVIVRYVPDFSTARALHNLRFETDVGVLAVPLETRVPHEVLSACRFAFPEMADPHRVWLSLWRGLVVVTVALALLVAAWQLLFQSPRAALAGDSVTTTTTTPPDEVGREGDPELAVDALLLEVKARAQPPPPVSAEDRSAQTVALSPVEPSVPVEPAPVVEVAASASSPPVAQRTVTPDRLSRRAARAASASAHQQQPATDAPAPGIVKETASIPAKARLSGKTRQQRTSSDSSHAESGDESSDDRWVAVLFHLFVLLKKNCTAHKTSWAPCFVFASKRLWSPLTQQHFVSVLQSWPRWTPNGYAFYPPLAPARCGSSACSSKCRARAAPRSARSILFCCCFSSTRFFFAAATCSKAAEAKLPRRHVGALWDQRRGRPHWRAAARAGAAAHSCASAQGRLDSAPARDCPQEGGQEAAQSRTGDGARPTHAIATSTARCDVTRGAHVRQRRRQQRHHVNR